mmetsp:Transcript_7221/g.5202  ORF Transcript_7221/g.5202 Transcript_7221/m.5202 type:complete len:203 (-) Transcript_7221:113-721(-)|eukprot:CAMPEP_0116878584 /NCGR_PEP_ID=MMETSP0463-20121206/10328_1 /TAXON_ID=181622 /ORGANISM="Strombidinopsis sp, Strain SopsisLIS2011" /LENGTH=202 /DNA_ID=CAMNT_0004526939 /DNA_START=180 /DNA_END=788 /DNA_ORIENTATION=+
MFGKLTFAAAAIASLVQAGELEHGPCPVYESNKLENFSSTNFSGLWYEYVATGDYTDKLNYQCSGWSVLRTDGESNKDSDKPLGSFIVYNSTKDPENAENDSFMQFDFTCKDDGNRCSYQRHEEAPEKHMSILKTDYYSYMVAAVCYEEGDHHRTDYVAMGRDKNPSIWSRREMRNEFLKNNIDLTNTINMYTEKCWGEDHY